MKRKGDVIELRFVQFQLGHHPETQGQMVFGLTADGVLYQHFRGEWSVYPMTYRVGS